MNLLKYIILMLTTAMLASCDSETQGSSLSRAEDALAAGNYTEAIDICSEISASDDTASMSATQMCRIAMIYAVAADNDIERETNIARSASWLDKASRTNTDSVINYMTSLSPEEMGIINQVQQLNNTRGYDFSRIEDEPVDSIQDAIDYYGYE